MHPNQTRKKVEKTLLRLVGEVAKCLGESYHDVFGVEKSCSVDDLTDIIKTEISFYRMENIPETFHMNQKHASKNVASYWTDVSLICDEVTGKPKYPKLSKLAFCILVLPHGNAELECGYSINKLMLGIHGTSLDDDTIIALRLVKDQLLKCNDIMNFKTTQDLLKSVQQSNQRYTEYLRVKAENKKRQRKRKRRSTWKLWNMMNRRNAEQKSNSTRRIGNC